LLKKRILIIPSLTRRIHIMILNHPRFVLTYGLYTNLTFGSNVDRTLIHKEILNFTIHFEGIGKPIEKLYKKG